MSANKQLQTPSLNATDPGQIINELSTAYKLFTQHNIDQRPYQAIAAETSATISFFLQSKSIGTPERLMEAESKVLGCYEKLKSYSKEFPQLQSRWEAK